MKQTSPKPEPSYLRIFLKHFFRNLILGSAFLIIILLIGIMGTHFFEKSEWIDSYANAAMIVSGVGVMKNPETFGGKIFIATYSIIGGASFLLIVAVVFAPIFHWAFRKINIEDREHFKD